VVEALKMTHHNGLGNMIIMGSLLELIQTRNLKEESTTSMDQMEKKCDILSLNT